MSSLPSSSRDDSVDATALASFVEHLAGEMEVDAILKRLDESSVLGLLLFVEARLGTPRECPGDLDLCQKLAHRLSNVRMKRCLSFRHGALLRPPAPDGGPDPAR